MSAELYKRLIEKRREIAKRDNIKNYQIFLDKAVEEMATHQPQTRDEFLQIWGTSAPMAQQYIDEFLDAICQYREERSIMRGRQFFGDQNMEHSELYTLLLETSRELAREEGGGIFTHRTLREMSERLPKTKTEFRRIHGVGPVKTKKYADIFLKIISDYCEEQGHPPSPQVAEASAACDQNPPAIVPVDEEQYADPSEYAPRLYKLLKAERNRIAREEGVRGFRVIWNRTLKQIAVYLPQTKREFFDTPGIGLKKTNRYADRFLPIIRDFCRENDISYDRVEPNLRELLDWLRR